MGVGTRAATTFDNGEPSNFLARGGGTIHISERSELTLSFESTGIVRLNYQCPIATTMISTNPDRWIALRPFNVRMGSERPIPFDFTQDCQSLNTVHKTGRSSASQKTLKLSETLKSPLAFERWARRPNLRACD